MRYFYILVYFVTTKVLKRAFWRKYVRKY